MIKHSSRRDMVKMAAAFEDKRKWEIFFILRTCCIIFCLICSFFSCDLARGNLFMRVAHLYHLLKVLWKVILPLSLVDSANRKAIPLELQWHSFPSSCQTTFSENSIWNVNK